MLKVYHLDLESDLNISNGNYFSTVLLLKIHTNVEMFLWDVNINNPGIFLATQNGTIMKM